MDSHVCNLIFLIMANFNLHPAIKQKEMKDVKVDLPNVIEGAEVYDVLCPVSKKTGHRENPLSLLVKVLPPDKERLAASILQELPSIRQEYPDISDGDAIDLCVDRLSTGSPFEDGQVRDALMNAADVLFPEHVADQVEKQMDVDPDAAQIVDNV